MDKDIIKLVNARLGDQEEFYTGANNYILWLDMYRDESPWTDGVKVHSMGLPSSIASELARLTTIEMVSNIAKDEELNEDYQVVINDARKFVEYGLALGGVILKPYADKDTMAVDYVTPDLYIPISFDNTGNISHIVFIDELQEGSTIYRRLEEHDLTGPTYIINNAAFKTKNEKILGKPIELTEVDSWSTIAEEAVVKNVDKPLFGYFKNPQANNLDLSSPMGISCYSRATSLIADADEQYSRIVWEYEGSELAIDADLTVLKASGELPKGKERLFRDLGVEQKDGFYKVFSPEIRDESLFNGLNKILMRIEFLCGLAYGTLSDIQTISKTAEEIRASKQRSYSTVVDIQKALQNTLEDLVESMIILRSHYFETPLTEPDISFEFDDSIVVDTKLEQAIRMQEVAAGLTKPESYLMWRYGVSEEENATGWILDKIKGFGSSVMKGIKGIFGIKSPSTLMRDEIGKNFALGIGVGFEMESDGLQKDVDREMIDLANKMKATVDVETQSVGRNVITSSDIYKNTSTTDENKDKEGIVHATFVIDGREAAKATAPYSSNEMEIAKKRRGQFAY